MRWARILRSGPSNLLPTSEYDALRKRVAADVARLRALNLVNVRQWWSALQEGYKLSNDQKESDWAADQSARHLPSNWKLPERTRWYQDHPGSDTPADQKKAYFSDLLKQTDAWIKQRPNSYYIWFDRLTALNNLDDAPPAEVEWCFAKALAVAQADRGPEPLDSTRIDWDFGIVKCLPLASRFEPLHETALESRLYGSWPQTGLGEIPSSAVNLNKWTTSGLLASLILRWFNFWIVRY